MHLQATEQNAEGCQKPWKLGRGLDKILFHNLQGEPAMQTPGSRSDSQPPDHEKVRSRLNHQGTDVLKL